MKIFFESPLNTYFMGHFLTAPLLFFFHFHSFLLNRYEQFWSQNVPRYDSKYWIRTMKSYFHPFHVMLFDIHTNENSKSGEEQEKKKKTLHCSKTQITKRERIFFFFFFSLCSFAFSWKCVKKIWGKEDLLSFGSRCEKGKNWFLMKKHFKWISKVLY